MLKAGDRLFEVHIHERRKDPIQIYEHEVVGMQPSLNGGSWSALVEQRQPEGSVSQWVLLNSGGEPIEGGRFQRTIERAGLPRIHEMRQLARKLRFQYQSIEAEIAVLEIALASRRETRKKQGVAKKTS